MSQEINDFRCGWAALIGRPNIGKSTLLNKMIGAKVSITSRRPQTTRHRILGILTREDYQVAFIDTPGIHQAGSSYINRIFNRAATSSVEMVDIVLMLIDARGWVDEDERVLNAVQKEKAQVILLINKMDLIHDTSQLLPLMKACSAKHDFTEIIPLSAKTGRGVEHMLSSFHSYLPKGQADFPKKMITDRTFRFMAAELVREQIFEQLGSELPYTSAVQVELFEQENNLYRVEVLVWIERESHKPIFLGKNGARMKRIATKARYEMEALFASKVFLKIWVKVKSGWAESDLSLRTLGYLDE